MSDLSVSAEALKFRLLDIFRFYTNEKYDAIVRAISAYQRGVVNGVLKFFDEIKEKVIEKYEAIKIDVTKMILKKVEETGFVTSLEFEELLDWEFCKKMRQNQNIEAWMEYHKGNLIAYIWNSGKLKKEEAKSKILRLFIYSE